MKPYYQDDLVTLYHADCLEHPELWVGADVLVTDPPYGIGWRGTKRGMAGGAMRPPIEGDETLDARDDCLELWGAKSAAVFGSPLQTPPTGARQALVWHKPANTGFMSAIGGFRRDWETIYLMGDWGERRAVRSAVIATPGSMNGYLNGHPHAKPIGVLETLINAAPPGTVADPFAGSGSTLVAAKRLGRKAIGVELEERYCEIAANRLRQDALPIWDLDGGAA